MQIVGQWDYILAMPRPDTQKELERIEQELNATASPPMEEGRVARVNRKQPHLDAVLLGVVALLAHDTILESSIDEPCARMALRPDVWASTIT